MTQDYNPSGNGNEYLLTPIKAVGLLSPFGGRHYLTDVVTILAFLNANLSPRTRNLQVPTSLCYVPNFMDMDKCTLERAGSWKLSISFRKRGR